MKTKRRSTKYKKPRPRKGSAKTTDAKARSMQTSFRKYTGTTLTIKDAKGIIEKPPDCPYCEQEIIWRDLSLDHIQPQSREGENVPENLVWCCQRCNRTKGNLTAEEYIALLAFLKEWPVMRESVLLRLRLGGIRMGRRRRGR